MEVMVPPPIIKAILTEVAGEVVPELWVEGVMQHIVMAEVQVQEVEPKEEMDIVPLVMAQVITVFFQVLVEAAPSFSMEETIMPVELVAMDR